MSRSVVRALAIGALLPAALGVAACGTAMRMCDTLYSLDSEGSFFCSSMNWSISRGETLMRAMTSRGPAA